MHRRRWGGQAKPRGGSRSGIIHDIRLKSGNAFRGQLPADLLAKWKKKEGIWIRFYQKRHLIAETKTDRLGRFSLYYLPAGTGRLMIGSGRTAKVCFCRLWAPGTAPPASNHPRSADPSSQSVARGQNLHVFPTMSFKEAATVVGVVGGAVATPVIWHNIQEDHKTPVSGS